ncbi:MAG: glycosyltransferase 87 family protein [Myxococcota bacterium]
MSTRLLWVVGVLGAAWRAFLLLATDGSLDAPILGAHGDQLLERGLVGYYETRRAVAPGIGALPPFNHPPPIAAVLAGLAWLAEAGVASFSFLWRLPFALLDAATAGMLVRVLADHPKRFAIAAAYWLHPLAVVYSAYQGNSDAAVAFFVLLAIHGTARGRPALAGAALGLCLWVKIPGLLAAPVLFFALPDARARLRFAAAGVATTLVGYAPALLVDPAAVVRAVWLYPGLVLQTRTGELVWGIQNLLPDGTLPASVEQRWIDWNTWICLAPLLLCAWLRRDQRGALALARNVGAGYATLYGLTQAFAFQYFAWSLPLWLLFPARIAWTASIVATAYVYGLYVWLTGSPWLLGPWDFAGRPDWPFPVLLARDAANLFFFVAAWAWLVRSIRRRAG